METISSLRRKNRKLSAEIRNNRSKIKKLRCKPLKWFDFSYCLPVETMDHLEGHPRFREGEAGSFGVKIIKNNVSVIYIDLLDENQALDVLIECEKTGNRYFTQRRFLRR